MDIYDFTVVLSSVNEAVGRNGGLFVNVFIEEDQIKYTRASNSEKSGLSIHELYRVFRNESFVNTSVLKESYRFGGKQSPAFALLKAAGLYDHEGNRILSVKDDHDGNIACNLIYNNGDEGDMVGFAGTCTLDNIVFNINKGKDRWCSQAACDCFKYKSEGFPEDWYPEDPCAESRVFTKFTWNSGFSFKDGDSFRMAHLRIGKMAVLTTCFKNEDEADRKIVGLMRINDANANHKIFSNEKNTIRLPLEVAQNLNFWNYHLNPNTTRPDWRQKRFRYLEDIQVAAILHDMREILLEPSEINKVNRWLKNDLSDYSAKRPYVFSALNTSVVKEIAKGRKYGKGGESKAHKKLKEWVGKNPGFIGIDYESISYELEHLYPSRDLVDILFYEETDIKKSTVVEIELDDVLPGIHQAIKYRTLRCSELGISLKSKSIRAVIVAWQLRDSEKELCEKYGIEYYTKRV